MRTVQARAFALRNGVRYRALRLTAAPQITVDTEAAIKSSVTFACLHDADVDFVNDKIQIVLELDATSYQMGIYCAGTVTRTFSETGDYDEIEAYDQGVILQQTRLETLLHLGAGALYTDVINDLLVATGIERVNLQPASYTLQTDREDWEIGTDLLSVINTLLSEINYGNVWFDRDGVVQIQPDTAASVENVSISYRGDAISMLSRAGTSTIDVYAAPNVFIVTVSNPDMDPMTAIAVNDNIDSALSTVRRKRRIVRVETLQNIASQDALQEYADEKCLKSMYATEEIKFETAINPKHSVGDVIAIYSDLATGLYVETGWNMKLAAGESMHHKARRVMYLD